MVASSLDWAFNNPQESDITVVLTTETAVEYRARRATQAAQANCRPATRQKPAAELPSPTEEAGPKSDSSSKQGRATPAACEELYGHKIILGSHSDFFKAAVNWSSGTATDLGTPSSSTGSKKRSREEAQVAVLSLADEEQFSSAKLMIKFMYTQQLDADLDRCEVLRLMLLADEFSVPNLRHACMVRLAATPLMQWSVEERQLLCSCWMPVAIDSLGDDELATAAKLLADSFAAYFTELEVVLADDNNWALLCSLPHAVILQVLSNDALVIRSENTALVAALSWLRTAGKYASELERKEVMAQVRLLQLSPWFLSWFVCNVSEAQELMVPGSLAELVRIGHSSRAAKKQLAEGSVFLVHCARARAGSNPDLTGSIGFSVAGQDLRDAVAKCFTHHGSGVAPVECEDCDSVWRGGSNLFNGMSWQPRVSVSWCDGKVEVFVSVSPSLKVGTDVLSFVAADGILEYGCDYTCTSNGTLHAAQNVAGAPLGQSYGIILFTISPDTEDAQAIIAQHLEGGCLALTYKVLA